VLSHGTDQGYTAAFDWVGTRDVTPWLSLAAAAEAYDAFGGPTLHARNAQLAAQAAEIIEDVIGGAPSAPKTMRAAMVSLCFRCDGAAEKAAVIRAKLRERGVIIAATGFGPVLCLRFSAQIYNQESDYRRCADVLREQGFPESVVSVP